MTRKYEPSSRTKHETRISSAAAVLHLKLDVSEPPPAVRKSLPDRYNLPLFELLVVDTEYVFISWEITLKQLDSARETLGETAFEARRLVVCFRETNSKGTVLHSQELYGEIGRWFIHLGRPGVMLNAELLFQHGDDSYQLNTTGPVSIPRISVVEPTEYDELRVSYGTESDGRLVIRGAIRRTTCDWPEIKLPPPHPDDYRKGTSDDLASSPGYAPSSAITNPGSRGRGWSLVNSRKMDISLGPGGGVADD